ncbi:hypothetical protein GCM10025734_27480 [Kitasatospora paranensis]
MVSTVAGRISSATGFWLVPRTVRQTAASPTSQTRYCGLITRLVTVNTSSAASAASKVVDGCQRAARSRHSSSQPKPSRVPATLTSEITGTQGPSISSEP